MTSIAKILSIKPNALTPIKQGSRTGAWVQTSTHRPVSVKNNTVALKAAAQICAKHGGLIDLKKENVRIIEDMYDFDKMISHNPVLGGYPKKDAMHLLMAGAGFPKTNAQNNTTLFIHAGMTFQIPHVPGIRSRRCALTLAGLYVIDQWAEKFPSFKPFHNVFIKPKRRKMIERWHEIHKKGEVPEEFQDIQKEHDEVVLRDAVWDALENDTQDATPWSAT